MARRDDRLVRYLVMLWPPARDAEIPVPAKPDGDSLKGLRSGRVPGDGGSGVGSCRKGSGVRAGPGSGQDGDCGSRCRRCGHRPSGRAIDGSRAGSDVERLGDPASRWQHIRGPDASVYELVASGSQATDLLATLVSVPPGGERVALATQRWVLPRWEGEADPVGSAADLGYQTGLRGQRAAVLR